MRIYDGYNVIGGTIKQFEFQVSQGTFNFVIDLPAPIRFVTDKIGLEIWSGAGVGDWFDITLVGWEELI